jgi:hypothetical protein
MLLSDHVLQSPFGGRSTQSEEAEDRQQYDYRTDYVYDLVHE